MFCKDISFAPDDVVEIQLPDNWPKVYYGERYDPKAPTKVPKNVNYIGIEKQSLFIKPVKE